MSDICQEKRMCMVYNTGNYTDEIMKIIPPFVHILQLFPLSGHGAGAYPSCLRARGGVHPGQVDSSTQDNKQRQTTIHTHSQSQLE